MITDLNFNELVEKSTGKKIGEDYGFIFGRSNPYAKTNGYFSVNTFEGFEVWVKDVEKIRTIKMGSEGIEKNLENVIKFLNNK